MTFCSLAFRVGESARIVDKATLTALQKEFSDRAITVHEMAQHAGKQVRICVADEAIGYQFEDIPGRWMEHCIVDLCFDPETKKLDPISYAPASETYSASSDVEYGAGYVSVSDTAGRLFLRFYCRNASSTADALNEKAKIRNRIAFEQNHGFDGIY